MNLLLLGDEDFEPDGTARVTGRRALHVHRVLKAAVGEQLRTGRLGGNLGLGEVLATSPAELHVRVTLDQPPPTRPGIDLLLAIPRPKALKKLLPAVASLGVDTVVLVNAARVEKSYFDSKVLNAAWIQELLRQGLEQGCDTRLPRVEIRERFRPCVEDELDALFGAQTRRWVMHPSAKQLLSTQTADALHERVVLAVGPEGGWVPFETELLEKQRFEPVTLGPRILRVEVCVPALMGYVQAIRSRSDLNRR